MDPAKLVGERLPALTLSDTSERRAVRLRAHTREATVMLLLPVRTGPLPSPLRRLLAAEREMRRWDGRLVVVVAEEDEESVVRMLREEVADSPPSTVLADPSGDLRQHFGLATDGVALLIADRWGQIYHAAEASPGGEHGALPGPDGVVEWLKYLATQCPECGVPDEPGYGDWSGKTL